MTSVWSLSTNINPEIINESSINFRGVNTNSDRATLTPNNTVLFLPLNNDWCIDFDLNSRNMFAFYFLQQQNSESDAVYVSFNNVDFNQFHHIKFEYDSSNHTIKYYRNDALSTTVDTSDFTNDIGFRLIDWQGDIYTTISNLKVYLTP